MSNHLIACRIASYGKYQERGWSHLPKIGVRHVEVGVPETPEQTAELMHRLSDHGLSASSLQCKVDIARDDAAEQMKPQLESCAVFEARVAFVSIHAGETPREQVWERLRAIGDAAQAQGVVVAMETHPDLITNGDVAQETMRQVDHPHVRVNFDTANVSYYNEGATATGELAKIIDYVGAVHLKDYGGGFKQWDFPALGTGVVDFPQIFQALDKQGFTGPYTLELEGVRDQEMDEQAQLNYVKQSVDYLKQVGVMG